MPQLDTSTWTSMILFSLITLFLIMQPKLASFYFSPTLTPKNYTSLEISYPWSLKWTKIYFPLSLPPRS
nr:ATP synthase F0 subunit 8 [Tachyoryctes macrocephalus]